MAGDYSDEEEEDIMHIDDLSSFPMERGGSGVPHVQRER